MLNLISLPWVRLAGAVLLALMLIGTGWTTRGWKADAAIAELHVERANLAAAQADAALKDIAAATTSIHEAALRYGSVQVNLASKIEELKKDIKNDKPLPVDCVPSAGRVRKLDAGIDAANASAAGHKPGKTVP